MSYTNDICLSNFPAYARLVHLSQIRASVFLKALCKYSTINEDKPYLGGTPTGQGFNLLCKQYNMIEKKKMILQGSYKKCKTDISALGEKNPKEKVKTVSL